MLHSKTQKHMPQYRVKTVDLSHGLEEKTEAQWGHRSEASLADAFIPIRGATDFIGNTTKQ